MDTRIHACIGLVLALSLGSCASVQGRQAGAGGSAAPSNQESQPIPAGPIPTAISDGVSPIARAPVDWSVKVETLRPSDAISKVMSALDASAIDTMEIAAGPKDSRVGPWFYATLNCPSVDNGGCIPALWEADLAQGSIAELINSSEANLANVVVGATVQVRLPDNSIDITGGDQGDVAARQQFTAGTDSDADIISRAAATIRADGLDVTTIRVLRPLGAALYVVATVPADSSDSGSYASLGALKIDLLGDPARFDGIYVQMNTADGDVIGRITVAERSGHGRLWFNPRYESLVGVPHG